jgi:hypothetical protein
MTASLLVRSPLAAHLSPISLDELNQRAELQTRVDRKYLVPVDCVDALLTQVAPDTRVLKIGDFRMFAYESIYFDTPDLVTYHLAAHRRRRRFKIRTRTYLDSGLCWLEVKTRGQRGSTIKHRLPYAQKDRTTLDPGRWFVNDVLAEQSISGVERMVFEPTLTTRYLRTTLLLPSTESRATIDTELSWEDDRGTAQNLPGLAVVETKNGSTASGMDRLLWTHGYRPIRISKYATTLAALRPDLPACRWRRTLRRDFAVAFDAQPENATP